MADPKVQIVITADGSQAGREVAKAGAELMKFGVGSVTVGNLLADLGRHALEIGKDLARFPLDAAIATGRYAEQLENLTAETGLAANEQQAYDVILNRAGLGLRDLSGIWRILSQNVVAARDPLSEQAAKFRQLGIELNGSEGPNQVLQLVSERLQALPDGFRKNALATELLGRSGTQFLPAFKEGLAGAANEAKRLGTILGDEARVKAAAFDNATDDLSKAWEGLTHQIGVLAAPALTILVTGMTDAIAETSKLTAEWNKATSAGAAFAEMVAKASPFTARGIAPPPAPSGTKTLAPGAIPDTDEFREALAASGRGFISADDRQGELASSIIARSQQSQFFTAHMKELDPGLASTFDIDQVMAREKADEASRARPDLSKLNELQRGIVAIRDLMPELDANEALELVTHNLEAGHAAVITAADDWRSYRDGLGDAAESARILESQQTELFQSEKGFIGAADAARRVSFARIDAEEAQKRQTILDTFGVSERGQQKLIDLETQTATQRMAVIRQFPTFWESQLQAVVNANSFSLGSIVSTWTSGTATAIVQQKNLSEAVKSAWQSTQIAVLQFGLNALAQWGAELALSAAREIGLATATAAAKTGLMTTRAAAEITAHTTVETTKTAVTATQEGIRVGLMLATNKVIMAGVISSLAGIAAVANAALGVLGAVITAVGVVFAAIAAGLAASVIGAPFAPAFAAAGATATAAGFAGLAIAAGAVQSAIGSAVVFSTGLLATPLAEGGIFTGAALIAEAGTPEVAIPLDQRGKRFMHQLGFGGGAGEQRIIVQMGDDVLVEKVLRGMPRMVRMKVGAAF